MAPKSKAKGSAPKKRAAKKEVKPTTYIVEHTITAKDLEINPSLVEDVKVGDVVALEVMSREDAIKAGIEVEKIEAELLEKNINYLYTADELKTDDSDVYKLTVTIADEVYSSSHADLAQAFLLIKPTSIKTKVFATIEKGGKTITRFFFVPQARRLFSSEVSAICIAKPIATLLP